MITNLLTNWMFLVVVLIVNFIGAVFLKDALKFTVKENEWLKYVFIIPPFALLSWVLAGLYGFYQWSKIIIVNYFVDK